MVWLISDNTPLPASRSMIPLTWRTWNSYTVMMSILYSTLYHVTTPSLWFMAPFVYLSLAWVPDHGCQTPHWFYHSLVPYVLNEIGPGVFRGRWSTSHSRSIRKSCPLSVVKKHETSTKTYTYSWRKERHPWIAFLSLDPWFASNLGIHLESKPCCQMCH